MEAGQFPKAATASEIKQILGPAGDETVIAVQDTGATAEEVREAFAWLDQEEQMGQMPQKTLSAKVRRVYDILAEERDRFDRDDRRE